MSKKECLAWLGRTLIELVCEATGSPPPPTITWPSNPHLPPPSPGPATPTSPHHHLAQQPPPPEPGFSTVPSQSVFCVVGV
ncbi:hypothetical protein Pcinc_032413 [Petrolisthes cinctipes]|uniref:Ig-like domain-containing protein n=1 Tax=Petrolisthes cinctipes TaxID=88211 RepID=A0AAE1EU59_PETCI|nr:hypothetical protein Pcinc_037847 [Petrolisthes cinctipes]KAK3861644.1 hypothetical protein Pcinc_032413 [Petrolisthes cinctipes]